MSTYTHVRRLTANLLTLGGVAISNAPTGTQIDLDSPSVKSDLMKNIGAYDFVSDNILHAGTHAPGGNDEVADLREAIRYQRLMRTLGYESETMQYSAASTSVATATGRVNLVGSYHFAGEVITNLIFAVNTVATTATLAKVGVWSAAGALLGGSASFHASLPVGKKVAPLTSPLVIPSDGFYWRGFLNVAATGAAVMRGIGGTSANAAIPGFMAPIGNMDSQTDLPSTLTVSSGGNSIAMWIAVS